jgi:hypothetical protein
METAEVWYIVQQPAGPCVILSSQEWRVEDERIQKYWGPFNSKGDAIARRVGLIRAGKCQPT